MTILGERRKCAGCGQRMSVNEKDWGWTPDPDCPGFCHKVVKGSYGRGRCSRPQGHRGNCGPMRESESVSGGLHWHMACLRTAKGEVPPQAPSPSEAPREEPEPEAAEPTIRCVPCRSIAPKATSEKLVRPSGKTYWACAECAAKRPDTPRA